MSAPAHLKVTRQDWLLAARDLLIRDGVGGLKVLPLSEQLKVSRSSFYWYFKDRTALLGDLLDDWEGRNTASLETYCAKPEKTITASLCNFFRCFVNPDLFDQGLDFAVRAWARQDQAVHQRVSAADERRLIAVEAMFVRHGYDQNEADIRARILYFQQLGYHALDQVEPIEARLARVEGYLKGFTGVTPLAEELQEFCEYARRVSP